MKSMTQSFSVDPAIDEGALWLRWLITLRWVALFAQAATLATTFTVLRSSWILVILLCVMTVLAAANIEAMARVRSGKEIQPTRLLAHLITEVVALTIFLGLSGGSANPFIVLFLIHVCMGAVMLTWGKATTVTVTVLLSYIALRYYSVPIDLSKHTIPEQTLAGLGELLAFAITAISATGFTIGVARTLRSHKAALLVARDRTARIDRLRTVGTLAAGAAHELNTPLFTINLRLRRIGRRFSDEDTAKDVQAIQSQLDRCKATVEQLLIGAGDPSASGIERSALGELVEDGYRLWAKGAQAEVKYSAPREPIFVDVPPIPFRQALINLLENAREAQDEIGVSAPIELQVRHEGEFGVVRVRDHGCGLPESVGDTVGEPFFTTKPAGTGLGVYVARAVADGAGGGLNYEERKGHWTEAVWWFPLATHRTEDPR